MVSIKQEWSFGVLEGWKWPRQDVFSQNLAMIVRCFGQQASLSNLFIISWRGDVVRDVAIEQWRVYVKECQVQLLPYQAQTVERCTRRVCVCRRQSIELALHNNQSSVGVHLSLMLCALQCGDCSYRLGTVSTMRKDGLFFLFCFGVCGCLHWKHS